MKNTKRDFTKLSKPEIIKANWTSYLYDRDRHFEYCKQAMRCEQMYYGAGEHWSAVDRQAMEESGRKCIEDNRILEAVNTAVGYQIANRIDIALKPRGRGADDDSAKMLSKVFMQICDNVGFKSLETEVTANGFIMQRGYYELSLNFDENMHGEMSLDTLDPMDVLPDSDAKHYDPDKWNRVTTTRWLTLDEIASMYGEEAAAEVEKGADGETDFGDGTDVNEVERNKFGNDASITYSADGAFDNGGVKRYRIIDRQHWLMTPGQVYVTPEGDIRDSLSLTQEQAAELRRNGASVINKRVRRVRWTVTTEAALLMDDWSPFQHFSIVPYFAIFRRGKTLGMVDNAIDSQEMLNKSLTTWLHAVNTTANSGYTVEEESLANMSIEDLKANGAKTGLVLEFRKGTQRPEKITGNQTPQGLRDLVEHAANSVKSTTAVNETSRGEGGLNQSGEALKSMQWAAQLAIAPMLDNMARTRNMLAKRMLKIVQRFYTEPQIIRIAETDKFGRSTTADIQINQQQADGSVLNNVTAGEYDIVITEQPTQVTFENGQFQQALELFKLGVLPPDMRHIVLRASSLADKAEILEQLQQTQGKTNPVDEAKANLIKAQTKKAEADTISTNVEALYSATNAAQLVASIPQVAGLADTIARSAGFKDADMAPIFPAVDPSLQVPPPDPGTNPATPPNPDVGLNTGIESLTR